MPETVITVQGSHTAWYPAERASVSISISADGPDRESVVIAVSRAADDARGTIEPLHEAGTITRWASDSLRVWSQRPWSETGEQLDPVHYAALDLTATFGDFPALSQWIERIIAIDRASVAGIHWTLTDARMTAVTAEVRSRAVKDAVSKATVYAQSIGLGSVTATAIADPGMLGDGAAPAPGFEPRMAMKMDASQGGGSLALKPEQIEVSAAVDARFVAR